MVPMGRVLVVHPPLTLARDFVDYPYFADLGAVQLAAELRQTHDVRLIDSYALPGSTLYWRRDGRGHLGASVDEVLTHIAAEEASIVVVAVTPFHRPPMRDDVLLAILRGMKSVLPRAPIVLADCYQSGQHYVETDALLDSYPEADAWVKYEGERTVPALIDVFFDRSERPRGVHRGEAPPDLDALALPAWDLVDLEARDRFAARVVEKSGRSSWQFAIDGRTLPAITSRGCPFRCAHCSSNPGLKEGEPKTQRRHGATSLARLLSALAREHGATRLAILDELVNVNAAHFDRVLDAIGELDVRFEVPNGFRADYLDQHHLARMKGRVTTASVSAESGAQRVLDEVVGKQLDLADIERVAKDAHRIGVPLMVHWMIGLPGESKEEIETTLALALSLHERYRAWPAVQFATPLPGTRLARGRTLPLVEDWGPCFQKNPSQPDASVDAHTLTALRRAFEERLRSGAPGAETQG